MQYGAMNFPIKPVSDELEHIAALGFDYLELAKVVLHPGHIGGLGLFVKETAMALANDSLVSIIGRAQELGLCVCLENMFPKCRAFFEPDDFVEILQRFPDLMLTLDIGHANIGGQGVRRALDFIEKFGPRLGHLHISDNSGKRDDHLPIGGGKIDFLKIAKAIKKCGYDDTATLEIFSDDRRELQKSRERFDEMLKSG